jgi:hypothetical protein
MELRNKTVLEVRVGERVYTLECNSDSMLGEIHDSLTQMKAYIVERINAQVDAENVKKSAEPVQEPLQES